jgi:hypothetical protein
MREKWIDRVEKQIFSCLKVDTFCTIEDSCEREREKIKKQEAA